MRLCHEIAAELYLSFSISVLSCKLSYIFRTFLPQKSHRWLSFLISQRNGPPCCINIGLFRRSAAEASLSTNTRLKLPQLAIYLRSISRSFCLSWQLWEFIVSALSHRLISQWVFLKVKLRFLLWSHFVFFVLGATYSTAASVHIAQFHPHCLWSSHKRSSFQLSITFQVLQLPPWSLSRHFGVSVFPPLIVFLLFFDRCLLFPVIFLLSVIALSHSRDYRIEQAHIWIGIQSAKEKVWRVLGTGRLLFFGNVVELWVWILGRWHVLSMTKESCCWTLFGTYRLGDALLLFYL